MAYAAYRESFANHHVNPVALAHSCDTNLMVMDVTVASADAFQVRALLAAIPETGVVRCIPRLNDHLVVLKVKLPENRVGDVMHLLMTDVMHAEIGALTSWKRHMIQHGMTHGF